MGLVGARMVYLTLRMPELISMMVSEDELDGPWEFWKGFIRGVADRTEAKVGHSEPL